MATTQQIKDALLDDLMDGKIDKATYRAKLAELDKARENGLRCEIGPAGGVCVYNLQNRPVTLYATPRKPGEQGQWQRLAAYMPEILQFIEDNMAQIEAQVAHALAEKEAGRTPVLLAWPPVEAEAEVEEEEPAAVEPPAPAPAPVAAPVAAAGKKRKAA